MSEQERDSRYSENNLVWVDLEMTGLQPEVNRVIEVAMVVTDPQLNIIHECPVVAIHQNKAVMDSMDEWNTKTHGRTGLTQRVLESTIDEEAASDIFIAELERFVPAGASPMCGSTIGQDRRFMARWMPRLENFFHYRSIDVSSIKELVRRWKPEEVWKGESDTKHQAISDVVESIDELRHYRERVMKI